MEAHCLCLSSRACASLHVSCCREIQPLETRAAGAGINVAVNMLFTFIIGQCFTTMLCSMRYGVFLFFAGANAMSSWLSHHAKGGPLLISKIPLLLPANIPVILACWQCALADLQHD